MLSAARWAQRWRQRLSENKGEMKTLHNALDYISQSYRGCSNNNCLPGSALVIVMEPLSVQYIHWCTIFDEPTELTSKKLNSIFKYCDLQGLASEIKLG